MTTTNDEDLPMGEAGKHPAGPGTGGIAQNLVGGAADAMQRSTERGDADAVAVASTGNAVGAEAPRIDRGGKDAPPGAGPGAIGAPTPGDPSGQRHGGGSVGAMGDGTSGGSAIGATSAESAGSRAPSTGSTGAGGGSRGSGGAAGSLDAHAATGAGVTGGTGATGSASSSSGSTSGRGAGAPRGVAAGYGSGQAGGSGTPAGGSGAGSASARAAASADRSAGAGSSSGGIDDAHGVGGGPAGSAHPGHVGDVTGSGSGAEVLGPADAKRDEGPLESLGRAISEVVTGPVDDARRDRLADGSSGRD